MENITFAQLRDYVGAETKEERVPSVRAIMERGTRTVIHGRFGKYHKMRVFDRGRLVYADDNGGVFEDVTLYPSEGSNRPLGKSLAGNDLSLLSEEICIRHEEGETFKINVIESNFDVFVDGVLMAKGMWLPEIQAREWRAEDSRRFQPKCETESGEYHSDGFYEHGEYLDQTVRSRMRSNLAEVMDRMSEITVFEDGSVVYYAEGRHSVFSLCKCRGYSYQSVMDSICMDRMVLDNMPWHIRLTMMGEDKISKNNSNKKNEVPWDYKGEELRLYEETVKEYFRKEALEDLAWELLLKLDEKSMRVIILRYFLNMENKEIAEDMKTSKKTVSRKAVAGIARLQREFVRKHGVKEKGKNDGA